ASRGHEPARGRDDRARVRPATADRLLAALLEKVPRPLDALRAEGIVSAGAQGMRDRFVTIGIVLGAAVQTAVAQSTPECDLPGEAPDIIVGDIGAQGQTDTNRWGTVNGTTAYSIASTSCNIGTCWANWFGSSPNHPVISQNLFDLKNGRFQQIGQSWIKHGFGVVPESFCGTCTTFSGTHLGVNCSDLYQALLNGQQMQLGRKYDVNPYTGVSVYPPPGMSETGNAIYKRLQVHNFDLDPAINPGVKYFAEIEYIAADDAAAGHAL